MIDSIAFTSRTTVHSEKFMLEWLFFNYLLAIEDFWIPFFAWTLNQKVLIWSFFFVHSNLIFHFKTMGYN